MLQIAGTIVTYAVLVFQLKTPARDGPNTYVTSNSTLSANTTWNDTQWIYTIKFVYSVIWIPENAVISGIGPVIEHYTIVVGEQYCPTYKKHILGVLLVIYIYNHLIAVMYNAVNRDTLVQLAIHDICGYCYWFNILL